MQRALAALTELRQRLSSPRTLFRERGKVQRAVEELLSQCEIEPWIRVTIETREDATCRQAQPGRPSKHTQYKKETRPRFHLTCELNAVAFANAERRRQS